MDTGGNNGEEKDKDHRLTNTNKDSNSSNTSDKSGTDSSKSSQSQGDTQPASDRLNLKLFERLSRYTIVILFIGASIAFFPIIRLFLIPVVLAATFAGLFYPLYCWFYNHLLHRSYLSSLLCCIILILGVLIPGYILIHIIIDQLIIFYASAVPWFHNFMQTWRENILIFKFLNSRLGDWLINNVNWPEIGRVLLNNIGSFATIIANRTYTGIFGLVFDLVIMLFVLFYFFIDGARILKRLQYLLPLKQKYQELAYRRFLLISEATIKGTLIIGLVDGFLGGLTLLIFGIDTWLVWGFVIMIFSILPIVGPSFVLLPAGIIQIVIGNIWQGIGILIVTYTIVVNADNFIRPRIVGSHARMHDLIVFFSTIGGLSVYGITGFIIGPIIASLLITIIDIYAEEFRPQLNGRGMEGMVDDNGDAAATDTPRTVE